MKLLIKTKEFLVYHKFIVIAALFLVLLIEAPLLYFPYYAGERYQGINIAHFGTDEHYYLTRAKDALEGHNLGQPALAEWKEKQDPTFSSIEAVVLFPLRLLKMADRVDVVTLYNFYNAAAIFAIIMLIYALQFSISGNRLLAAATALFVVGGYSIVYNKGLFYEDFNIYGRSVIPWGALIPFYIMLNLLYLGVSKAKTGWIIAAGLVFGFLFYDYFYAWTLSLSLLAAMAVSYIVFKQAKVAKSIAISLCLGIVLGLPVLFGMLELYRSSMGEQLSYFLMSSAGRTAVFSKIGFITLVLLAVYFFKNRQDKNIPFYLGLVVTGWIVLNEQVITGRYIQYGHYYWYFIVPLSIITSAYVVFNLFPVDHRLLNIFGSWGGKASARISALLPKTVVGFSLYKFRHLALIVVIGVVFLNTAVGQYCSFFTVTEFKLREQDYVPIITELNKLPYGVILMADHGFPYALLFTIYTRHDLLWDGHALIHQFPVEHMKDAFFVNIYLNKDARGDFYGYLTDALKNKKHNSYTYFYEGLEGFYSGLNIYEYRRQAEVPTRHIAALRDRLVKSLAEEYSETIGKGESVPQLLKSYGIRYVVWDKEMNPEWDLSPLNAEKLFSARGLELFSLPAI